MGGLSYALFFVEVDAFKDLVRSVEMNLPKGKSRVQLVVYEHEPKIYGKC